MVFGGVLNFSSASLFWRSGDFGDYYPFRPMYITSRLKKLHFSGFNLIPLSLKRCKNVSTFFTCSSKVLP